MGALFSSPDIPKLPPPPDPVRVSDPNDPNVIAARRAKESQDDAQKQGRQSTILSSDGTNTNAPTYSRSTLG